MKPHWRHLIFSHRLCCDPLLLQIYLDICLATYIWMQKWEAKLKSKQSWWKLSKPPSKFFARLEIFMSRAWRELAFGVPTMSLPKSRYSVNSLKGCDDENFGQLLCVASSRIIEGELQPNGMARSYSFCVGKIGRIEEDKSCAFEANLMFYPRSRSHIVKRN